VEQTRQDVLLAGPLGEIEPVPTCHKFLCPVLADVDDNSVLRALEVFPFEFLSIHDARLRVCALLELRVGEGNLSDGNAHRLLVVVHDAQEVVFRPHGWGYAVRCRASIRLYGFRAPLLFRARLWYTLRCQAERTAGKATSLFRRSGRQHEDVAALPLGLSFQRSKRGIPNVVPMDDFHVVLVAVDFKKNEPVLSVSVRDAHDNPVVRLARFLILSVEVGRIERGVQDFAALFWRKVAVLVVVAGEDVALDDDRPALRADCRVHVRGELRQLHVALGRGEVLVRHFRDGLDGLDLQIPRLVHGVALPVRLWRGLRRFGLLHHETPFDGVGECREMSFAAQISLLAKTENPCFVGLA